MSSFGIANFGLFCLSVLLLNATPGPDTAYIVGRSIAQGRAAGLLSALGISAGCCLHALALALGLSALLATSTSAFTVVKIAGSAYLIWMGLTMLRQPAAAVAETTLPPRPLALIFWQAVATNILNPKIILFFLSFIPQFVHPDSTGNITPFLLLGLTLAVISLAWNSATALLAAAAMRRAGRNSDLRCWLQRAAGALFIMLGGGLAFTKN